MTLETWITFCAMDVVLCFTPGPAVLFVISVALARGERPGMRAALVFFTALVPQFIDTTRTIAPQVVILGLSSTMIELGALGVYVAVCHRTRISAGGARFATMLQKAGGFVLFGAAARLAAASR